MVNLNNAVQLAQQLIEQNEAYTNKTTKAESKRMRDTLNELKKVVTSAKADLMKADQR